jgi:hypothetical protein
MKTIYKQAAMSAVVLSMFAIAAPAGAAEALDGGPNDAYCIRAGGSPWCGYATYSQCEESASGIGADCVANAFGEPAGEQDRGAFRRSSTMR